MKMNIKIKINENKNKIKKDVSSEKKEEFK